MQVDYTHDEKSTAALYDGLWKMLEMILKVYIFFKLWTRYLGKKSD